MFERFTGYGQRAEDGVIEKLFTVEDETEKYTITEWVFNLWGFKFIPYEKIDHRYVGEKRTMSQLRLDALAKMQEVKGDYINLYIKESFGFVGFQNESYRREHEKPVWLNGNWTFYKGDDS